MPPRFELFARDDGGRKKEVCALPQNHLCDRPKGALTPSGLQIYPASYPSPTTTKHNFGLAVPHSLPGTIVDFFGIDVLPAYPASLHAFATTDNRTEADGDAYKLLHYLHPAHRPTIGQEAAVGLFVSKILERLGHVEGHRIIMIQHTLPLFICGFDSSAETDVCILDDNVDVLLLMQGDAHLEPGLDPEPHVIAQAIAAFQRKFPPIIETASLNDAVKTGVFPAVETTVYRHIPWLPHPNSEGMESLDNGAVLLQYLRHSSSLFWFECVFDFFGLGNTN
ncbi:hypothetical protein C8R43DRAFT_953089 [Mycena crocata]|nr:hypothetical protein C8R43DRAFT_953089 [Mycena crocata]